jgi:AcrR family transcriptional regulator
MVQQERAQVTRDRLIDGAALAFYRLGYGMATTNDIVNEAGATRGAMYFHFESKEEIARAVIEKEHELAMAAGIRIQQLNRPPFETLVLMCVDLAHRLKTDPVVKAGIRLTTEITNFDPPLRAPYEGWLAAVADLSAAAVKTGDFRADVDPDAFARFLIPAYTGVQFVSDAFSGHDDLLPRIRELWGFVLPAVIPDDRLAEARELLDRLIPQRTDHP